MLKKGTARMVFAAAAFLAFAASYVLVYPLYFGLCPNVGEGINPIGPACFLGLRGISGLAIFYFAISLSLLSLLLAFLRKEIFTTWLKFSLWAFPLFVFLSISMGGVGRGFFVPNEEEWAAIFSWLFVIISLVIIAWKYWRLQRKTTAKK